jgi:hypothetical protein
MAETSSLPADRPDLDRWIANPAIRVEHRRDSSAAPGRLWDAARQVPLSDATRLGQLIRWRIPGTRPDLRFDELFRSQPFMVLAEAEQALVSGLVGRIWTLRRDYPRLDGSEEFLDWSQSGTARVVFANWVAPAGPGRSALHSEARVEPIGVQGRLGVAAVRPLVRAFQGLVASDGIAAAVRLAERGG